MIDVLLIRSVGLPRPSMERYADLLESGASAAEFRVEGRSPPIGPLSERRGFNRLDGYVRRWAALPAALARGRADVIRRFDVVHIVDHTFAHLIRVLPAERTVVTCHDLMRLKLALGELPRSRERAIVGPARFRWSVSHLSRAARVVCPSAATGADVIRLCGVAPERVQVIPHCVEDRFRPLSEQRRGEVRRELGLENQRLVLHVSSGGFYKNIPVTLRVLAELRASLDGVVLLRAGATLTAEERRLAGQLGVEDAVRDLGSVSEDRLVDLYGVADLLIFPSLYEGFGWPVLEAMACATPVVTSRAPALMDLVGDAGLTADADDVAALTEATHAVLADRATAASLSSAVYARASTFTRQRTLDAYASAWREVATGKTPRVMALADPSGSTP